MGENADFVSPASLLQVVKTRIINRDIFVGHCFVV